MDSGWIDDTKLWPMVQRSFVNDYMVKAIDQDGKAAQDYRGFAEGINLFDSGNVGKAFCQSKDGICSIKLCSKLQCWVGIAPGSSPPHALERCARLDRAREPNVRDGSS
ncbi:uncharacterized protein LOC125944025 [Dermacentor silvarum]|uniref:uncharacterized protein LOC125944025 n=1 Tax=Dermacentor silvarum TaxID=543639 RepID=UPI00210193EE|nr:uncharacterized protein LOC125944025 [Dermacentor silvarum]